ncbi:MAG: penicillin acylase family protein [Rhodoferax sp.]
MHIAVKILAATVTTTLIAVGGAATWHLHQKMPVRNGTVHVRTLSAPVTVTYDDRGVPHIQAQNEADLYRTLGYVHAQDRLFQMEMVRRLANGELAELLGPKLLETDKLFRTLGLRDHAQKESQAMDLNSPSGKALVAYLDGINQFQDSHPAPLEFEVLHIPKRPFTVQDTLAVSGYLAYSFAAALRTDPPLTFVRDKLGPDYLRIFDLDWHPEGVVGRGSAAYRARATTSSLRDKDWEGLQHLAALGQSALETAGVPVFEGSNAWVISGKRTASGKPLLAGDPHIAYSAPSVWYEAHLSAPGFELYGHYQALNPVALLGHNRQFGWSLTMFENDDIDLVAEKPNPANANQVAIGGQWVDLQVRTETIKVKGASDVQLNLRRSPHGPIITDAFKDLFGDTPIAMWWAFLETENPVLQAFYELNRADTRDKARAAAQKIHSPGLNIVWANTAGDIGWWAAAKLPIRPAGVNPTFILDGSAPESDKLGWYDFRFNPQEENPARGYIVSANHQPKPRSGVPVPGYYCLSDRAERLDAALRAPDKSWDIPAAQALQLDSSNGYGPRVLADLMPILKAVTTDAYDKAFLEPLAVWDGDYTRDSVAALLFTQLMYELAHAAMADELGEVQFNNLARTFALDHALPRLVADANSPWWDNVNTKEKEGRFETVRVAWTNTLRHLEGAIGSDLLQWKWGLNHTLTHVHPLGMQKPLDKLFNIGPFMVAGGRETPNNMNYQLGTGPWAVKSGPSTRRVIDFAQPDQAIGINPVGQSGVLFDKHYADQAGYFAEGLYMRQFFSAADIKAHAEGTLILQP